MQFLKLHNTFTKELNIVKIAGKKVTPLQDGTTAYGSLYICGPTVYSDSHLGHALTYIRADLLRRFLKSLFNLRLQTVMNITDIDDKILLKTSQLYSEGTSVPSEHPFNRLSDRYYNSFLADMHTLRVLPADLYVRVSKHIHLITDYIRELEQKKYTYTSKSGDIHFKVSAVKNYKGRVDERKEKTDLHKQDQRDFVLWKSAKPGEPVWWYNSSSTSQDRCIPGRPGWHVQCSAISNALFGSKLDFHFGGKDLIFPHHYNEEACCCAYHQLDTTNTMHVWVQNWLHSGHLIFRDIKMSKSLGNVILIKDFIRTSSVNVLRLLCVYSHYRSDLEFNNDLIDKIKAVDHKISAFGSYLNTELKRIQESVGAVNDKDDKSQLDSDIKSAILSTHDEIVGGVCDDFHLDRGLDSILNLSKLVYSRDMKPQDLIAIRSLLEDWCDTCGLEYGMGKNTSSNAELLLDLISGFRQRVRLLALEELRDGKSQGKELMQECDNVRSQLDELGLVFRDPKTKKS